LREGINYSKENALTSEIPRATRFFQERNSMILKTKL